MKTAGHSESFIVTGGAGFIGSNLVAAINRRGCTDILVVDHLNHPAKRRNLAPLKFKKYMEKTEFRMRLRDDQLSSVSTVFHLGACSSTTETDEAYLVDNNYNFSRELCQWSLRHGVRFVYASSAATYGDGSRGYSDQDDVTRTLLPLNLYGRSKQLLDLWALENGLTAQIVGLKYFNVYGPGEDHKGDMRSLVNKAHAEILQTGCLKLFKSHRPDYGDGMQNRDFVYVKDAVAVTLFFHDHPEACGIFNCGTGTTRTWLDLAHAVFSAMKRPTAIVFTDMPPSIRDKYQYHTQADITKLRQAGYGDSFTSVEDGVGDYVRNHLS